MKWKFDHLQRPLQSRGWRLEEANETEIRVSEGKLNVSREGDQKEATIEEKERNP